MKAPRILVVEDDPAVRQLFRTGLTLAGFDVDFAGDGLSALHKLDEQRPDLVVLDLQLPRLGGDVVLQELAANPRLRGTPVIVVTGTDPCPAIAQSQAILRKPCEPERLIQVIEKHLAASVEATARELRLRIP